MLYGTILFRPGLNQFSDEVPTQFSGFAKGVTPLPLGSHTSSPHFRLEAVDHHPAASAQGVTGAPQIVSTDAVEHRFDTVTGKAMNLVHEVRVLVVDGNAAQLPDHCGPLRGARSVHLDASQLRQLQHRRPHATRGAVN
jgi:hypothetical protein